MIEFIVHISDIHLTEKNSDNLINQISKINLDKYPKDKTLIVCTGDVYNNRPTPQEIINCKKIIRKLTKHHPMVMIAGNHDMSSRVYSGTENYLSSTVYNLETPNKLSYYSKRGNYKYENIQFTLTEYQDEEVYVPKKTKKVKIGLYHGPLDGSKTDTSTMQGHFSPKDFDKFDFVLLGDIHKQQYFGRNKWYSGSFIQLNHGETIDNHGYVELNLLTKESKFIHIPNDTIYKTIKIKNNISDYTIPDLTKKIHLRIEYENTDKNILEKIKSDLKNKYSIESYIETETIISQKKEKEEINIIEDIKTHIKEIDVEEVMKEIKINQDNKKKNNIKIKNLYIKNFTKYGENNVINFDKIHNKITSLSGENGIGKTSIFNAILICLYDTKYKLDYVNKQKDEMIVSINLDINDVNYDITRKYKLTKSKVVHSLSIKENKLDINCKTINEINKKIVELVGTEKEFIHSVIIEQNNYKSFIKRTGKERYEKIKSEYNLDAYENIEKELEKKLKEYKNETRLYNKQINDLNEKIIKVIELKNNEDEIKDKTKLKNQYEYEIQNNKKYDEKMIRLINENKDVKYVDNQEKIDKNNILIKEKSIEIQKIEIYKDNTEVILKNEEEIKKIQKIDKQDLSTKLILLMNKKKNLEKDVKRIDRVSEKEIDDINLLISQNTNNIKEILEISNEELEKYDRYIIVSKEIIEQKNKIKNVEKYLELLKDHSYNKDCNICMNNQKTCSKIEKEKELELLNKTLVELCFEINNGLENVKLKIDINNKNKESNNNILIENEKLSHKLKLKQDIFEKYNELNKIVNSNEIDIITNLLKENDKNEILLTTQKELIEKQKIFEKNQNQYLINERIMIEIKELEEENKKYMLERDLEFAKKIQDIKVELKKIDEELIILNKLQKEFNINEQNKIKNEIYKEQQTKIMEEFTKKQKELKKIEKILETINGKFVDNLLSTKILPQLEIRINNILNHFVDWSVKFVLEDEEVNIYKLDKNQKTSNASLLSGYESILLEVIYRITTNTITFGNTYNCLLCDEIFSYMDNTNIEKIVQLFEFMKKYYDFIIVISHDNKIQMFSDDSLLIKHVKDNSYICNDNKLLDEKKDFLKDIKMNKN